MRKSIATVSLSGTLPQKLEAVAAAGFDAIELFEADFINFNGSAAELKARADDLGLGIDLYQPFRDFEGMPEPLFRRSLDRAEAKFDLMQALGTPLMLVCSNTSPQSLNDPALAAAQLHELAERAARRGLRIGYEALAWGRWVNLYRQAWDIVQRGDHPALGMILDSFHTLSLRDDPTGIRIIPGDRIFFVQMADAPLMAMDVLQWARHHRNFPGQGQFDLEHFFEQVLRAGYTGNLSLEIFNDVFRATPNRRTALDAMRSLLYLESQVRGRLQRAGDAAIVDRVPLADPPAAAPFDGFAFIEFAVDPAAGRALGELLEHFGFHRHGQHRSKDVALYRQGDIRLVLNAQPGSDAQARFAQQGTSVCTIGLSTRDPRQAAERGQALLSARCDSPRGAQELELPAIVSPGGIVMQFVPTGQDIEADFVPADGAAADGGAGLRTIDHVALGLANDQLDTWTLFSRAVLDLSSGESLELADPFGLIRSRGVANADGSVRFVLNTSVGDHTRTARQVSASGRSGGGVHHIAFGCDDIFATMAQLRARGARFVPISANYYDDLIARLALDETLVRRMQALDILYDASPDAPDSGRYFHAYSETIDDRFFFEIVQRDRYEAYGALNAPARLAAQAQDPSPATPAPSR
jgi:4-hydroxyphenylpyruvate dioxygenase